MARKAQPKLVRFEDGIYWFVAKLAAEKTGLTKPELARRAFAGDLRYKDDTFGNPVWFAEPDIEPLREAALAKQLNSKPTMRRPKTQKQLEREWAKSAKLTDVPLRQGPVYAHAEKIMLKEIENANNKKR
jgi:hypothetical protein